MFELGFTYMDGCIAHKIVGILADGEYVVQFGVPKPTEDNERIVTEEEIAYKAL